MPLYLTQNVQEKCVMARINRQKTRYQANFTLARYGTWEKANRAARKWVKEILPTLPEPMSSRDRKTTRNTSGVVGVRLANATRTKDGRTYPDWRWVAFWTGCPQNGGIGWSVNKYGDEGAFVCACLARKNESIDRADIETRYARLVGTKRHASILAQKRLTPPPLPKAGKASSAATKKAITRKKPAPRAPARTSAKPAVAKTRRTGKQA
ncbi:hypothetical protein VVD49_02790 [Uliginosibacterium sp. H3]|uniref:AP2 domain-containing protein n=1 Tax=Uliginosibacterium silvisoli TaxID=3114758 RepID=A0ABU6K0M3_9RHOO|nr:hypothetical protein [Uliginosibacterium sp. H3]